MHKNHNWPFPSVNSLPSREDAPANESRRPAHPVVRVLTPWNGGTSKHLKLALAAYLRHPANLPGDPGPGPYPVAGRFDPAAITKGMTLAKESNRAAFIRRVLAWHFPYLQARSLSAKPCVSVPKVATSSSSAISDASVKRSEPPPKNLSDQEYIQRLYQGKNRL